VALTVRGGVFTLPRTLDGTPSVFGFGRGEAPGRRNARPGDN
jgi:hypothetical protein